METIVGVALYDNEKECILISLSKPFRHGSLFKALHAANELFHIENRIDISPEKIIQGFVTNTGRFLNRIDARELAISNNQFIEREDNKNFTILFSEDIW